MSTLATSLHIFIFEVVALKPICPLDRKLIIASWIKKARVRVARPPHMNFHPSRISPLTCSWPKSNGCQILPQANFLSHGHPCNAARHKKVIAH